MVRIATLPMAPISALPVACIVALPVARCVSALFMGQRLCHNGFTGNGSGAGQKSVPSLCETVFLHGVVPNAR